MTTRQRFEVDMNDREVVIEIKKLYQVINEVKAVHNDLEKKEVLTDGEKAQHKLTTHLLKIYEKR